MKKNSNHTLTVYTPYSNTDETCYIKGESGMYYPGVRIENISFPLTISAIQAAVCSCLANGDVPEMLYQASAESELKSYWMNEFNLSFSSELPSNPKIYNPLLPEETDVITMLEDLCSTAVTIHSNFPVTALLKTEAGLVPGVNVEVGAWALGLCAERVAISRALAAGLQEFEAIHIYAPKGQFSSPCGACRQVLAEHMPDKPVELHHDKVTLSKHFTNHLLPYGFITSSLNK